MSEKEKEEDEKDWDRNSQWKYKSVWERDRQTERKTQEIRIGEGDRHTQRERERERERLEKKYQRLLKQHITNSRLVIQTADSNGLLACFYIHVYQGGWKILMDIKSNCLIIMLFTKALSFMLTVSKASVSSINIWKIRTWWPHCLIRLIYNNTNMHTYL